MKINGFLIIAVGCLMCLAACRTSRSNTKGDYISVEDSIASALDYQIKNYPSSQYRDVYKNFMQDFFGPGHILADTAASGRYLRHELAESETFGGPLYEKTGYKGNFYRVNLSLLKDGVIPYDVFFKAFVESVQGIVPPSGEDWMKTWNKIDGVISGKRLHFHDEEKDRMDLARQFEEGNYIAHHSKRYNDSVHFHYRIISRDNFEQILLPIIKAKR
ncbi:MAG: hypothetical protein K2G13_09915 [Muribaculaceae bacterium]|nr:hypothetical protein [Muribaculaceae bacterium]